MRAAGVQARADRRAAMKGGVFLAALLAGASVQAQDNSTTTIPAPGIERFSLPPGNSQAIPTPTPATPAATPTPSATPAPPPVVPTLTTPRPAPTPILAPTRAAPAARPTPDAPAPSPLAVPTVTETPAPVETPTPIATGTPAPPAIAATASGPPGWLWWIGGLAVFAAVATVAWRRFAGGTRAEMIADARAASTPQPETPPAPTPSPPARPVAAPQPDNALVIDLRPQRLWTRGPDAHLAFELRVTNAGAAVADAVRPVIVLASAGPDTAAHIAAFTAEAQTMPSGEPFALRTGETHAIAGELTLPGDAMYVTSAAERELIVPVVLVSLQWRAGLSVARTTEAFVIGTGDAGAARLGPIWVDRAGLAYARLDARRFTPGAGPLASATSI